MTMNQMKKIFVHQNKSIVTTTLFMKILIISKVKSVMSYFSFILFLAKDTIDITENSNVMV